MDGNWKYCGDNFTLYTNIESLYCAPETNVMSIIPQLKKKKKADVSYPCAVQILLLTFGTGAEVSYGVCGSLTSLNILLPARHGFIYRPEPSLSNELALSLLNHFLVPGRCINCLHPRESHEEGEISAQ